MSWTQSFEHRDSRQKMAELVDVPGFSGPLPFADPELPLSASTSRLIQGPFVMDGDLCDIMPGHEAIILVSPKGERILMQNEGRATFHVPAGWRILVGSKPIRSEGQVKRLIRVGESVQEVDSIQSMLCLENIPDLYREADPFRPAR